MGEDDGFAARLKARAMGVGRLARQMAGGVQAVLQGLPDRVVASTLDVVVIISIRSHDAFLGGAVV
ncbi:hypothetical protein PproGo58_39970 [Pseudomonas protegens]|nr:hypothetical protein PproGo58_39970 [Pseudomonas protegens]